MFVYATAPAANVATSGTANTEVDHLRTLTGAARAASIQALYLIGKGAGLTAISGIVARLKKMSPASTAGTGITPVPRQPSNPAAALTAFTGPTAGTPATNPYELAVGCGAAGPGGWVSPNPDSNIQLEAGGGANGNIDLFSASGTVSLNFEYSLEHAE